MPRKSRLSLDLLETFLTLVNCNGDASRAAKTLNINQPSMSKRLKSLQYAGAPLQHPWLERVGKTWVLTEEGERVRPAVQELLDRHRQLTRFVTNSSEQSVHVVAGQRSSAVVMRNAMLEFHKQHPDISVRISTKRSVERVEMVAVGHADFALVSHSEQEVQQIARRSLHVEDFLDSPLLLCGSPHAVWSGQLKNLQKKALEPNDLGKFPLILPEPDSGIRHQIDVWIESYTGGSVQINTILETGGWPVILEYLKAGLGVGFLPADYLPKDFDLLHIELENGQSLNAVNHLVCRFSNDTEKEFDLSEPAQAFWDCLKRQVI